MFKQPSRRINCRGTNKVIRPTEGTLMHYILTPRPTSYPVIRSGPIHNYDDYIRLFKRNSEVMGIPFVEREYPKCAPPVLTTHIEEPKLEYSDQVQVSLKVLKNGLVRIKINTAISSLYEKYYSQCRKPPIKAVVQAYKSHGFSDTFIERIIEGSEKKLEYGKKIGAIIDKIFDTKSMKKTKKKKEMEVEVEADESDIEPENDDEDKDDAIPEEDGGLDVEPDEDEVVEEEEEYISDVE